MGSFYFFQNGVEFVRVCFFLIFWASIELQTADEESDLVNEYDFPTQSDFKQVTIEDFSSRALCSGNT